MLNNYPYPKEVVFAFNQFRDFTEQEAYASLACLKATRLDPSLKVFVHWFLKNRGEGLFKIAMAEKAFLLRDSELLRLTMNEGFIPFKEDLVEVVIAGRDDIIEVVSQHTKIDPMTIIEGAIRSNNKDQFDKQASLAEKDVKDVNEFYMRVLELGRKERHYERAKQWVWERGYQLYHPNELP